MLIVDNEKARQVFDRLVKAYLDNEYPFNQPEAVLPQIPENLPPGMEWGSRSHALFLFKLCYWMRGGIESDKATRRLTSLYLTNPEIFFPEDHWRLNTTSMGLILREAGLGFNADEIAAFWIFNQLDILRRYEGDPRNIFKGVNTYEEACARVQRKNGLGFLGFQEKMVSMLLYFYMDAGIVDPWEFPIPVDFHVLRTVFAHEIVVASEKDANANGFYTKPVLATVRVLCEEYCVESGVSPLILCNAVWIYSRVMCSEYAGNGSMVIGMRAGRKTPIAPIPRWTPTQTRTYERTCAVCPVSETCKWSVPSAEYYIHGRLVLRGLRDTPSQQSFSF